MSRSAVRTRPPLRACERVIHVAANRAGLGRVGGIDLDHFDRRPRRLVFENTQKLRHACIVESASVLFPAPPRHPCRLQRFDNYPASELRDCGRGLMDVVLPDAGNPVMDFGDAKLRLLASSASFLFARQCLLRTAQFRQVAFERVRILKHDNFSGVANAHGRQPPLSDVYRDGRSVGRKDQASAARQPRRKKR